MSSEATIYCLIGAFIFHSFSSSSNAEFSFPVRFVVAGCEVEADSMLVGHKYLHFFIRAGLPWPGEYLVMA